MWKSDLMAHNSLRLFSQTLLLLEGEKANCHCTHLEIRFCF